MWKYKRYFTILMVLFLVTGMAAAGLRAPSTADAATEVSKAGIVTTKESPLNVRKSPSVSGQWITTLPRGSMVTLLDFEDGWWHIEYAKGKLGYCSGDYITVIEDSVAGYVNTQVTPLNVRSGPGLFYGVKTGLVKGSLFVVVSESDGWCYILYDGVSTGYVSSQYVKRFVINSNTSTNEPADLPTTSEPTANPTTSEPTDNPTTSEPTDNPTTSEPTDNPTTSESTANPTTSEPTDNPSTNEPADLPTAEPSTGNDDSGLVNVSLDIPKLYQSDSRWGWYSIGTTGGTIRSIGCLVTGLAMSETYRTGNVIYPDAQAATMKFTAGGGAYWPSNYRLFFAATKEEYLNKAYELLVEENKPVLIGNKTASGGQHWVLITGFNGADAGYLAPEFFTINDPGSTKRYTVADVWAAYPIVYYIAYYV